MYNTPCGTNQHKKKQTKKQGISDITEIGYSLAIRSWFAHSFYVAGKVI